MPRLLRISVAPMDVLEFPVDVLVLKYAQGLYGADKGVYSRLASTGVGFELPAPGQFLLRDSNAAIKAKRVLFVGVPLLRDFSYAAIRSFAYSAINFLALNIPDIRSVAFTIHGPGYGLDEIEAFESEFAGIIDAATTHAAPINLDTVTFVELDLGRARRLTQALKSVLPSGIISIEERGSIVTLDKSIQQVVLNAGKLSSKKSHIFVAMPFAPEMDDLFHYGIQGAVNAVGFLCERSDLASFTGDVLGWIKERIASAKLVIADLSGSNPNVYLEVGYAWGVQVSTVLIAGNATDLKFDVKGQKCLIYKSINDLEVQLAAVLKDLLKGN